MVYSIHANTMNDHDYQEYFVKYSLKAMNDFSKLFFDKNGNIDNLKFKEFFELPRIISEEGRRTANIQKKLNLIKYLDLNRETGMQEAEQFFSRDFDFLKSYNAPGENPIKSQEKSILKKQEIEPESNAINNANVVAIKKANKKANELNDQSLSLKHVQKENETSFIRCVGLTIETKSYFGKLYHGNLMLELGCTRVEIGIQSVYDNVLEATNRGNTTADNIESLRILKDLGFKINCHYMPGLPLTTKDDLQAFNNDFICVPRREIIDYVTTSGTIGAPVTFAIVSFVTASTSERSLSYPTPISNVKVISFAGRLKFVIIADASLLLGMIIKLFPSVLMTELRHVISLIYPSLPESSLT